MRSRFAIHVAEGAVQLLDLAGREEWALSHLIAAGDRGCTPIDTPGPRWSHYVWLLRGRGINVETITEAHGGPYAGHHARYVLRSRVDRPSPQTSGAIPQIGKDAPQGLGADHVG